MRQDRQIGRLRAQEDLSDGAHRSSAIIAGNRPLLVLGSGG